MKYQSSRLVLPLTLALAGALFASCGSDDSTTPPPPTGSFNGTIHIVDNAFSPADVTISVGDSVTWNWEGSNFHSVTEGIDASTPPDSLRLFDEGPKSSGTFGYRFTTAATVNYFCRPHFSMGMKGIVRVQ